jgi:hypothetical protein
MVKKLDKFWIGILLGLALPALVGWVYIERFNLWYTFETFDWQLMKPILGKICQVGVFPNMALLFVFYTLEWWQLAKGILLAAIPYLIASVALMM